MSARQLALGMSFATALLAVRLHAEEPVEIEVRGRALAAPPKAPDVAGSVLRRDRLQAPGLRASDALRSQPGVSVNETGGLNAPATASLRGATSAQTPVYLAGVRLNDDVGGSADLGSVPLWFLNRIEIYRSHAPVAGDQLGVGGAIFLEPRKPSGKEAVLGVMAGSYGAQAVHGSLGLGDARGGALLGLRLERAKNDYSFENDNGTRFDPSQAHRQTLSNADAKRLELWGVGNVRLGEQARADIVLNDSEREQGMPSLALFTTVAARARITRRLGAVSTRAACGNHCELSTSSSGLWTQSRYSDPLNEIGLGAPELTLRGTRVEHAVSVTHTPWPAFSWSPALRVAVERLHLDSSKQVDVNARRSFLRAALQGAVRPLERLTLRALGSAECHGTALGGAVPWASAGDVQALDGRGACGTREFSGRFGVSVDATWVEVLATAGRYARVPTLAELYGTSGVVRGNTALVPETGLSVELGTRSSAALSHALAGLEFDVFGFARTADELISYQRASVGYVRPYNVGSARVLGLEAQLGQSPGPYVSWELAATLMDPRDTSDTRPVRNVLPHQPRTTLAPRVELHSLRHAGRFNHAKVSALYLYQGARFADRANLIAIPEQGSLDVEAQLSFLDEHVLASARVANLLSQTRFDLIGYPLPGRAVYVSAELKL